MTLTVCAIDAETAAEGLPLVAHMSYDIVKPPDQPLKAPLRQVTNETYLLAAGAAARAGGSGGHHRRREADGGMRT